MRTLMVIPVLLVGPNAAILPPVAGGACGVARPASLTVSKHGQGKGVNFARRVKAFPRASNRTSMSNLQQALSTLAPARLQGIRRGIEKESLRATAEGTLALTPHPVALGSALTHPHITTDYSESQVELITGVHASVEQCLEELTQVHQFVYRALGN